MLGIGLGGFTSGVETGVGIGAKISKIREERQKKQMFSDAAAQGQVDYDAAVAGGTEDAGDPSGVLRFTAARVRSALAEDGDYEGAMAANEFLKSNEADRGTRLYMSSMVKFQNGDVRGALNDVSALGKLKGYAGDFSLDSAEELPGGKWRLQVTDQDGNVQNKDASVLDMSTMVNTIFNSQSATNYFVDKDKRERYEKLLGGGSQPAPASVSDKIVQIESGGDPTAKNPDSSATGAGQFIKKTWLEQIKKHRPDLLKGRTSKQVLDLRNDPDLSREMTDRYAEQNGEFLEAAGLPVTPATTYLAHFLGADGATSVLQADPDTKVSTLLSRSAIRANGNVLRGKTAAQVQAWAQQKMGDTGGEPVRLAQADATTMNDAAPISLSPLTQGAGLPQVGGGGLSPVAPEGAPQQFAAPGGAQPAVDGVGVQPQAPAPQAPARPAGPLASAVAPVVQQQRPFNLSQDQGDFLAALGPDEGMPLLGKHVMESNTTVMKNLKAAGYTPGTPEFEEALRQYIAKPSTNITMAGETEYAKKTGGAIGERVLGVFDAAQTQRQRLSQYEQIGELLSDPNVYTGTAAGTINAIKKAGATLFGMEGLEGVSNVEAAERVRTAMFAGFRKEMLSGSTSDEDRKMVMQIPPNITDSPEGIQFVLEIQRRSAQLAREKATMLQGMIQQSPNGSLDIQDWTRFMQESAGSVITPEDIARAKEIASGNTVKRGPAAGAQGVVDGIRQKYGLE